MSFNLSHIPTARLFPSFRSPLVIILPSCMAAASPRPSRGPSSYEGRASSQAILSENAPVRGAMRLKALSTCKRALKPRSAEARARATLIDAWGIRF